MGIHEPLDLPQVNKKSTASNDEDPFTAWDPGGRRVVVWKWENWGYIAPSKTHVFFIGKSTVNGNFQ